MPTTAIVRTTLLLSLIFSVTILQSQSISGQLKDAEGLTLPGVNIQIQGTTIGTTTDMDGKYSLNVSPGTHTILFKFIGFKTEAKKVIVKDGAPITLSFSMVTDQALLDEVVVVGYGVQRKREVTGSIATIETKAITALPTSSFDAALQGQAAGVNITTGSGLAGTSSLIRIRGISSISAVGDPLIIVDGIPISQDNFYNESGGDRGGMNNNPLGFLNPNDIGSVEVLKDAAATGIYGARGANGVILITTKRGLGQGNSRNWTINYNARVSLATSVVKPNMLNSSQYLQLYQEAWENDGNTGLAPLPGGISWDDARKTNTDWVDELTQIGVKHQNNISFSRSSDKLSTYISAGYDHNESYIKGSSANRSSVRLNLDYKVNDKLKIGTSLNLNNYIVNRVDAAWSGGYGQAMSNALPIYPIYHLRDVYNADSVLIHKAGDFYRATGNNLNPVADLEQKKRRSNEFRGFSNVYAIYEPIKNLILRADVRYEYFQVLDELYWAPNHNKTRIDEQIGSAKRYSTYNNNYNFTLTANYLYALNEKNKFNFLLGKEFQDSWNLSWRNLEYKPIDAPLWEYDGNPTLTNAGSATLTRTRFDSYFGRINYSYDNKYYVQTTLRTDGSSKFGVNNKYGFFPSASAGWIITEEEFMSDMPKISFLKLRVSTGKTGNSGIPDDQWYGEYQQSNTGYGNNPYIYPVRLENPNLRWETSTTYDAAIEFGFFQDRITGDFSGYYRVTKDLLMNPSTAPSTGFSTFWDNVGSLMNRGLELNLKSINIAKKDFMWTTSFNAAYNYNKILSIGDYSQDAFSGGTNDTRAVVGYPVGELYMVPFSHIDKATGQPVYIDINGNETFDYNEEQDRRPVGDVLPDVLGGLTNSLSYKRWDLSALFYYSYGAKIYDASQRRQSTYLGDFAWNSRTEVADRWRQPGDDAAFPVATFNDETHGGSAIGWFTTDYYVYRADYIRLRNLSLGYTLPLKGWKTSPNSKLRFELSATNLWTLTNFPGLDPEILRDAESQQARNMAGNINYLSAPVERTYNASLNLTF